MDETEGYWEFPPTKLFDGTTEKAVIDKCSEETRAYWKKVSKKRNGFIYVERVAFIGGEGKHLPDDFVEAWCSLVMGDKTFAKSTLARACISNPNLRALALKYKKKV